jgi:putative SOS response-associated peptidase YedK
MCGRFTLFSSEEALAKAFGAALPPDFAPRYNIAPAQPVAVVRTPPEGRGRELTHLHWGLIPSWAKDPAIGSRLINARAETVADRPAFRSALRYRRCLIPADGFYEWLRSTGGRRPFFIRMRDGSPFAFAGLWDRWEGADGSVIESCALITTEANELVAKIHDRMPAIVPPDRYDLWLDRTVQKPDAVKSLLSPYPADAMAAHPVSTAVNNARVDDRRLIEPEKPAA